MTSWDERTDTGETICPILAFSGGVGGAWPVALFPFVMCLGSPGLAERLLRRQLISEIFGEVDVAAENAEEAEGWRPSGAHLFSGEAMPASRKRRKGQPLRGQTQAGEWGSQHRSVRLNASKRLPRRLGGNRMNA